MIGRRTGLKYDCVRKRTLRATKKLKKILEKANFSCPA